ncbi:acyl-CoA synthetase (AMP-forming)/AMP-acid ligase II [Prauserella muralis]|nr:acyl-CoA synthetase (AMP-forming)/AMP-acid ligase II [Prauserella muralis]
MTAIVAVIVAVRHNGGIDFCPSRTGSRVRRWFAGRVRTVRDSSRCPGGPEREGTTIHGIEASIGLRPHASNAAADIVEGLVESSQRSPFGMVSFPDVDRSIRLADLEAMSARRASYLLSNGIPATEPVGVLASHRPEFLVDLFGVLRAGATAVVLPFNPGAQHYRAGLQTIVEAMDAARLQYVVAGGALETVGERLLEVRPETKLCGAGVADALLPLPRLHHSQPALVQLSAGPDGELVCNAFTHGQVVAGVRAVRWSAGLGLEDVLVQWLPMHDSLGLFGLLSQLFVGGRVHAFGPHRMTSAPGDVLAYLAKVQATVTLGRAGCYLRLSEAAQHANVARQGLTRWRVGLIGGALEPDVLTRFRDAFAAAGVRESTPTPMYQVPAVAFAVTCKQPDTEPTVASVDEHLLRGPGRVGFVPEDSAAPRIRLVSSGYPVVGMRLRIVGPDGRPAPANGVGDIEVSGGAVFSGYHRDLRRTLQSLRNGWFRTGDRGFLWNGELFVLPRGQRADD